MVMINFILVQYPLLKKITDIDLRLIRGIEYFLNDRRLFTRLVGTDFSINVVWSWESLSAPLAFPPNVSGFYNFFLAN